MGFVGRVVSFERTVVDGAQAPEVSVDRDGDEVVTAFHFSAPGDDAPPLPGDLVHLGEGAGAGAVDALGYQDPATAGSAAPGERRLYARSADGAVAVELWLKGDGSVELLTGDTAIVVNADGVRLGSRDAKQFVALAELVAEQLTILKNAIESAPVTALDGGAAFKAGLVLALTNWPASVAAEKVSAK